MNQYWVSVITNLVYGLALTIAGVYAFIVVYGWWTAIAAFIVGGLLQAWHYGGIWLTVRRNQSLEAAVERARKHGND
jgi:hypothetical protein